MRKNMNITANLKASILNASAKRSPARFYRETANGAEADKAVRTVQDVLAAANAKVASLMSQGYMISFTNSLLNYKFRVDLEKNSVYVRVKVTEVHVFPEIMFELSVVSIPHPDGIEQPYATVFYRKMWYAIGGDTDRNYVLTESKEEFISVIEKRKERANQKYGEAAHRRGSLTPDENLKPTAALIRKLKNRKGFTNSTRERILVRRVAEGYEVSLKAREGHIRRVEVIRFPDC